MNICINCGSKNLIEGKMRKFGEVVFILSNNRIPVSNSAAACACENCGYIRLNFDPDNLKIMFKKDVGFGIVT
ncbi:hypothetical protein ACFL7D_04750 [candidate division KSB1 bacterium]